MLMQTNSLFTYASTSSMETKRRKGVDPFIHEDDEVVGNNG